MTTYYTVSGNPVVQTRGSSKQIRDEFTLIQTAFANVDTILATKASPTFTGTVVLPAATSIGNVSATELAYLDGVTSAIQTQLDALVVVDATKSPLASPTFTGTPAAPTAAPGTNTTQLATTAFVVAEAFSAALPSQTGNGGKYITTDGTTASWGSLAAYAPLASPTFTGTPAAPTAAGGTNTTQLATTAFVAASFAPLASPTLTGTPAAPTAAAGTNTTQVATTAFVTGAVGGYVAGAVGTYAMCRDSGGGTLAFGDTVAGSALENAGINFPASVAASIAGLASLSGTWRCMGYMAGSTNDTTIFVRIS